jgi:hypothetical protein
MGLKEDKGFVTLRFPSDVDGMRGMYIRVYGVDIAAPPEVMTGLGKFGTDVYNKALDISEGTILGVGNDGKPITDNLNKDLGRAAGTVLAAVPDAKTYLANELTNRYPDVNKALIFLPMPMDVTTSYNASWSGQNLNSIEYAIRNSSKGSIKSDKDITKFLARNLVAGVTEGGIAAVTSAMNVSRARGAIKATGKVWNPYVELMYDSPNLRTFNYDWTFSPKNPKESQALNQIIHVLKKAMHPIVKGNVDESIIWEYPDYVDLKFVDNSSIDSNKNSTSENPWLFQMLKCAISSVTVHYDNKFHPDGSPAIVSLQLSFMETELITQNNYDASGTDLDSTNIPVGEASIPGVDLTKFNPNYNP